LLLVPSSVSQDVFRVFTLRLKVVFEFLSGHKDQSFFISNLEVNGSFFLRYFRPVICI